MAGAPLGIASGPIASLRPKTNGGHGSCRLMICDILSAMKTVSLTRRWKKLGKLNEWARFTVPVSPGRAVSRVKGDDIWVRWEPTMRQPPGA